MEDEIEKSVGLLNLALDNSHVNASFRIVGIERHPAMPQRQFRAEDWIVNDRRAKSRRDELEADLVYALVDDPTGVAGSACQPGSFTPSTGEHCFWGSVNNWTPSIRAFDNENIWQTILRHEVGHNLGIQHSPEFGGDPRGGFHPGSVGYTVTSGDPWFGTVMGGNELPRFSTSSERFDFLEHRNLVVGRRGIHEASTALLYSIGPVSNYRNGNPPPEPEPEPGSCADDGLCFHDGRFEVRVAWSTADKNGRGGPFPLDGLDGGLFWFFEAANPELLVKVLDGCGVNRHWWVYVAAATDVAFDVTVRRTDTGESKVYRHHGGELARALGDISAFSCR